MGSKKRKINYVNQPNVYNENKEIDIIKIVQTLTSNIIPMREIDGHFSILLNRAYLNKVFNSFDWQNGNFLTFLIFKIQLYYGKPFSNPKIIKWKTNSKDVNPVFNKRIYFDNYNIILNIYSIMFEIKYVQYNRIKEIISNETKY